MASGSLTRAIVVLAVAGAVLLLTGSAVIAVGVLAPQLISSQIPAGVIDTPAVGGGMVALGVGGDFLGLVHIGAALAARRGMALGLVGGAVLSATMAVIAFLFAVAALVSAASGAATPIIMLPAAVVLAPASVVYAAAALLLVGRVRSSPRT
jgi:hypothetical protein